MISPGWPATLPTCSLSSGTTRYCLPPVLMTANIFPSCSYPRLRRDPAGLLVQSVYVNDFSYLAAAETQNERTRPEPIPHAGFLWRPRAAVSRKPPISASWLRAAAKHFSGGSRCHVGL